MTFNQPIRIIIAVLLCLLLGVSKMSDVAHEHLVSPYPHFDTNGFV